MIKGGGSKLYSDAAKNPSPGLHTIEPMSSERLNKNTTAAASDSGIDVRSLEKLIDERIALTLEMKRNEEPTNHRVAEKLSDEKVINIVYAGKTEITEPEPQWATTHQRDLNRQVATGDD